MAKKKSNYYTRMLKICRQQWTRSNVERKECLNKAKLPDLKPSKWMCAHCFDFYALSEIDCDHINPIENSTPQTKEEFIYCFERLHCPSECLQILCKTCHKIKTKHEKTQNESAWYRSEIKNLLEKMNMDDIELEDLEYKQLQRLCNIILKIEESVEEKKKQTWRKKLLEFMKGFK